LAIDPPVRIRLKELPDANRQKGGTEYVRNPVYAAHRPIYIDGTNGDKSCDNKPKADYRSGDPAWATNHEI
jgi:hypothetical protein